MKRLILVLVILKILSFGWKVEAGPICPGKWKGLSPDIVVNADFGKKLILCGTGPYEVFAIDSKGTASTAIFSFEISEDIKKYGKDNALIIEEQIYFREKLTPVVRNSIKCDAKTCKHSQSCLFKPFAMPETSLSNLKETLVRKDRIDLKTFYQVIDLALNGNKNARSTIRSKELQESTDGESAEALSYTLEMIAKMDKLNCPKRPKP